MQPHGLAISIYNWILRRLTPELDSYITLSYKINENSDIKYESSLCRQSSQVIKDMIDFKSSATRALLTHPVIEAFLNYKWQKSKKFFMLNFIIYLLFLITYSVFLGK